MQVRFFDPGRAYTKIRPEIDLEMQRVLSAGDLVLRKDLEVFEENLAKFVGKKYAVGVNSGTDALYLSLWALGIGPGDEVIAPSHTFVATIQVIHQLGATPVLVDVADDFLMEDKIEVITSRTKAIIPVHLTGSVRKAVVSFVVDMQAKGIYVIEDAAQALGAEGVGYGTTQCWSFYPAKILGAYGDAGAITTDDFVLAEELRQLRHHYKIDYSQWGINSRLDNLQAAVLNVKMKYLPDAIAKREKIASRYSNELIIGVQRPKATPGRVWQDYIIRLSDKNQRDELYKFLHKNGIETMLNEYPFPIPKLPNSLAIEATTLRLPCNENLTDEEVSYVIAKVGEFYGW